ncbi:MAG: lactate utilization protein [Longimicrobiales bacterium]|nr:lactate utilization protein [Longimicrobiales bacterium]
MSARDRILARIAGTLERRKRAEHPGPFAGARPDPSPPPLDGFEAMFRKAGGEVVRLPGESDVRRWLGTLNGVASATLGAAISPELAGELPQAEAKKADLGISRARAAIAETGTLVLFSSDGRSSQLLPPTHVVLVDADDVYPTLNAALAEIRTELPAAVGLHSGTSKSADIGQVMVEGVHGPGRVIALVLGADRAPGGPGDRHPPT